MVDDGGYDGDSVEERGWGRRRGETRRALSFNPVASVVGFLYVGFASALALSLISPFRPSRSFGFFRGLAIGRRDKNKVELSAANGSDVK